LSIEFAAVAPQSIPKALFREENGRQIMRARHVMALTLVLFMFLGIAQQAIAEDYGAQCRRVQLMVQEAVGNEDRAIYRNHGAYVSTVARMVDEYVMSGEISDECASCIVSQFARRIPIEEQVPCGQLEEVRNILGPEVNLNFCDGDPVGTTSIVDLGPAGLEITVEFTSGPPSTPLEVYWTCTVVPNGCHDDECNVISLGGSNTDGAGYGMFQITLPGGNPFPGK
jgi:hypothetical protein